LTLAERGVSVFLTSHILEIVERLADRFALIVRGEVVCSQTIPDLGRAGKTLEQLYLDYAGKPETGNLGWLGRR
jgi:ABC-2 type transport system ATP-binding protein